MNDNIESKTSNFFVVNIRNSWLLRAIFASNLNVLTLNLFRPDLIRGSLTKKLFRVTEQYMSEQGLILSEAQDVTWRINRKAKRGKNSIVRIVHSIARAIERDHVLSMPLV